MTISMEPEETNTAAVDHHEQAKSFLQKSRQYLADEDLHQASEKGWGAAAHMAKAVAAVHGWKYETHDEFDDVLEKASVLAGNDRIHNHGNAANYLHRNYYKRKRFLNPRYIQQNLDNVEELIQLLEGLLNPS